MTATAADAALAAEAVALGMSAAEDYMATAAATPGVGAPVALPSTPGVLGLPPRGLGFDLPPSVPALRRPEPRPEPTQTFGSPLLAGQSFGDVKGLLDALEGTASRSSTYRFVSASSPRTPLLDRIRAAFGALLGRR
jgi:hypothetical protein